MTSQPPFVPGLALPMSSPFDAVHSASPRTRQPVKVEPLNAPSGLKLAGSAALRPSAIATRAAVETASERSEFFITLPIRMSPRKPRAGHVPNVR